MKHTQGEWIARNRGVTIFDREAQKELLIAVAYGEEPEERKANIHLIAAAPELLAALKRVLSILESEPEACGIYIEHQRIAREAITKAEGK
jgi:hypothetical protein